MEPWTADFTNDPNDDYNLTLEILYNDELIAIVKHGDSGLEIHWYSNPDELIIPFEWLYGLLAKAKRRLIRIDE